MSTLKSAITISLSLSVSSTATEKLPSHHTHDAGKSLKEYPISSQPSPPSSATYYENLSTAIKSSIQDIGVVLTDWRDSVGDEEKEKERIAASLARARIEAGDVSDEEESI